MRLSKAQVLLVLVLFDFTLTAWSVPQCTTAKSDCYSCKTIVNSTCTADVACAATSAGKWMLKVLV